MYCNYMWIYNQHILLSQLSGDHTRHRQQNIILQSNYQDDLVVRTEIVLAGTLRRWKIKN